MSFDLGSLAGVDALELHTSGERLGPAPSALSALEALTSRLASELA